MSAKTTRDTSITVMTGMLDELRLLTDAANRPDLSDRLTSARGRVTDPTVRVVVTGEAEQGMSSLVDALAGARVTRHGAMQRLPVLVSHAAAPVVRAREGTGEHGPRIDVGTPNALLAEGMQLVDAPGSYGADSAAAASVLELVAGADAVLFVSDASQEYTAPEIEFLVQLHQLCPTVIGVITKIDLYPRWADIQRADRRHLDAAGLDIPLLPVSALLAEAAAQDDDQILGVESGLPQLVSYLRERVVGDADTVLRDSVVNDVRTVSDHLTMTWNARLDALRDPAGGADLVNRLRHAAAAADQLRTTSASWQLTLGDGIAELVAEVEHDLRHRLRELVREAEADIMRADPVPRWDRFDLWLRGRVAENVQANFVLAHVRSGQLAERVAQRFAAEGRVAVPRLHLDHLGDALEPVRPLEALDSRKAGLGQRVINSLRGSYGGILMVGVATGLAGLALINPWSIGAGVLLGANTFWDDRRNRTTRRQAEARVAVARLMDDVVFQVGEELRYRLREVHRTLRDHFASVAAELARSADESLAAAQQATEAHSMHREGRMQELSSLLAQVRQLRVRAAALAR
ncbi:MAG TPA: EutP/PduV family microcompartment system protein [Pseudonocardia sp.]|jgi:ethanolamine utilization protein EutP (predicted NTPase)